MKSCDIIIPVWNQLEATRECVDSIMAHTNRPYRLIVIDNGSLEPTADYLNSLQGTAGANILLIRNSENLGFVKAVNEGITSSSAQYICLMNNDTLVTNGWLEEMVEIIERDDSIGVVNPSSNTSGQCPASDESIASYAENQKRFKTQVQELYTARGFCMLMKRETIDDIGMFDEHYSIGYFEETDFCKRAQIKGYRIVRAKGSYVYHKENTSFKELSGNKQIFEENEKLFFKKWGRPLRIGYFLDKIDSAETVNDMATGIVEKGHQIYIFLKNGLDWPVKIDHFEIRRRAMPSLFFGIASFYKVIERRKKLDVILTDDPALGSFLAAVKFLHGLDVLIKPTKDGLIDVLNEKSKLF